MPLKKNLSLSKEKKIESFNPNDAAIFDGIFGLPFNADESDTIIIPVPWEVTVSYHSGTAKGPQAILEASYQVDLFDPFLKDAWKKGIYFEKINKTILKKSNTLRKKALRYLQLSEKKSKQAQKQSKQLLKEINAACGWMNEWVENTATKFLQQNKLVVLIGGDHSTPLGLIKAASKKFGNFSLLQIDAHADLRNAYQGFQYSHASIMYNVLKEVNQLEKLVQVGIRDFCEEEYNITQTHSKVKTFYDKDIKHDLYRGDSWDRICNRIINELSEKVYISFDIDGLDPKLCPNTGTPVAGGFDTEQVLYLVEKIVLSGRKIIAFDINEVSPAKDNDWDANVAARLLYRMINIAQK
ncbi:MAG TPA: agmatinase family protein [Bacteroidia bacterium]|nr:agmatinase family protein [Bacteroidia bacterium]